MWSESKPFETQPNRSEVSNLVPAYWWHPQRVARVTTPCLNGKSEDKAARDLLRLERPELCRAVHSRLLCETDVLAENTGSEATFNMSHPAPVIDTFISHSWRTPYDLKRFALHYHF